MNLISTFNPFSQVSSEIQTFKSIDENMLYGHSHFRVVKGYVLFENEFGFEHMEWLK